MGSLAEVDRRTLLGNGTVLKGKFGGQLRLFGWRALEGAVDLLLEVPTGLHSTDVEIGGTHGCLLPSVRLAEACAKTLVKLSWVVYSGKSHRFSWF